MTRPFLTAHWSNLAILSYAVEKELLLPHLPKGCELDTLHDLCYVSLVAFEFDEVKVKGWSIPFHTSFPEINLRFYVRCAGQRGVVFLREYVPRSLITLVASIIYNEPYATARMEADIHRVCTGTEVRHTLYKNGRKNTLTVGTTRDPPLLQPANSDAAWFKEHEWGFNSDRSGRTVRYRVAHPQWQTYHVTWHEVKFDFRGVYGDKWAFLRKQRPANVILAEGSPVTVFGGEPLTR